MEPVREIYAVCHVNDVAKRRAVGYVLARVVEGGKVVPFPVVIVRHVGKYYGYVNRCPHQGSRLDFEPKSFLDPTQRFLLCGKHGAQFDIATGVCNDGPCVGAQLEKVDVVIDEEEVCLAGVQIAEEDGLDREDNEIYPEVVITSD